jgi:hypothetical protein
MGHGLRIKPQGLHVAFAAGTGTLCFVDLVAAVLQSHLGIFNNNSSINDARKVSRDGTEMDAHSFQLKLFVSFPRRNESVALEFLEAAEAFCRRENIDNFHLYVRLSQEGVNPQRWDENFIRQQVSALGGAAQIQRLWVCGPPVMNETFDRVLSAQSDAMG